VFVLGRGNEEKKMNSFSSKEKLYITNLIWPPYNFSPSSATGCSEGEKRIMVVAAREKGEQWGRTRRTGKWVRDLNPN